MANDPLGLQGHRAGLVSRGAAAVIDAFAVSAVCVLALVCAGVARYLVLGGPFTLPSPPRGLASAAAGGIAIGYLTWGWVSTGRTPGDQMMGLRVLARSGGRLGLARALLRVALCTFFPAGLLWVAVSRHRASLHDLVVHSIVIYDWCRGDARPGYGP
ncbi:RDD family protein [Spirillospora sp. NPDC047279]|uniref:RDD family protein n=1 Tax=Spirillospora sp. NPDC047279 TaxID=3155478 RepID=UPI0033FEC4EA